MGRTGLCPLWPWLRPVSSEIQATERDSDLAWNTVFLLGMYRIYGSSWPDIWQLIKIRFWFLLKWYPGTGYLNITDIITRPEICITLISDCINFLQNSAIKSAKRADSTANQSMCYHSDWSFFGI